MAVFSSKWLARLQGLPEDDDNDAGGEDDDDDENGSGERASIVLWYGPFAADRQARAPLTRLPK